MSTAKLVVSGCGFVMTAAAVALWRLTNTVPIPVAVLGVLFLLAPLFEQVLYRRPGKRPVGFDWIRTDEKFIDPTTNQPVTVYYQPSTGERRYVSDDGPKS